MTDDRIPDEDDLPFSDVDAVEVRRKIEDRDGLSQKEVNLLSRQLESYLRGDDADYEAVVYDVLEFLPDTEYGPADAPDLEGYDAQSD